MELLALVSAGEFLCLKMELGTIATEGVLQEKRLFRPLDLSM